MALGGICSAVCLLLMFSSSFLPMLDYTIPTFAGFMMVVMIVEVDKNWAIATYCAVSLLSIFVTPNYEATLLFILFMGYYPILKYYLDQKKNRLLVWAIKLAVFNVAIVIFFLAFQYIFTSVDMLEGMEMFGKYAVLVLWAAANLFFFIYDYALTQLTDMYINWFRKKILRRKRERNIKRGENTNCKAQEKNTDNKPCCNNSGHSNGYSGVYTSYKSASQQGRHCSLGA